MGESPDSDLPAGTTRESPWHVSPACRAEAVVSDTPPVSDPPPASDAPLRPWRTIWFSPRQTVRQLRATQPAPDWRPLYALAFVAFALSVVNNWLAAPNSTYADLVRHLAVMLVMWIGWITIGVDLITRYGRLRGGRGLKREIRLATVWTNIPMIALSPFWVPLWIVNGGQGVQAFDGSAPLIPTLLYMVTETGNYWALVIWIAAVAELHRFSLWKSFETTLVIAILQAVAYVVLLRLVRL